MLLLTVLAGAGYVLAVELLLDGFSSTRFVLMLGIIAFNVPLSLMVLALLAFHVYFIANGITTYEYLTGKVSERKKVAQQRSWRQAPPFGQARHAATAKAGNNLSVSVAPPQTEENSAVTPTLQDSNASADAVRKYLDVVISDSWQAGNDASVRASRPTRHPTHVSSKSSIASINSIRVELKRSVSSFVFGSGLPEVPTERRANSVCEI